MIGQCGETVGILQALVAMINPIILKTKGSEEMDEGCLSFPNKFAKVVRQQKLQQNILIEKEKE